MKKVKVETRFKNAVDAFFADENFSPGQLAVRERSDVARNRNDAEFLNETFNFWAFAKCLLFYVPGVAVLFYVTLVLTEFVIFQNENVGNFTFAFFWLGFGAFLTMFGIGKLGELKYLKVVASVLIASFAVALSLYFLPDGMKNNFFGSYSLYFLPLAAFTGYLAKKWVDNEKTDFV